MSTSRAPCPAPARLGLSMVLFLSASLLLPSPGVAQEQQAPEPAPAGPAGAADSPRETVVAWSLPFRRDAPAQPEDGGSYITLPGLPFHEYEAFTIEVWVRDWFGPLLSQGVAGDAENSLWLSISPRLQPGASQASCGYEGRDGKTYELATGQVQNPYRWSHVALLYDGRRMRLFVNGQLVSETEAPRPGRMQEGRELVIGAHAHAGGPEEWKYGRGQLGAVRISRVARYDEEFTPPLDLASDDDTLLLFDQWTLQEGKIIDRSQHRRHARLHGPLRAEFTANPQPPRPGHPDDAGGDQPGRPDEHPLPDPPPGVRVIPAPMAINALAAAPDKGLVAAGGLRPSGHAHRLSGTGRVIVLAIEPPAGEEPSVAVEAAPALVLNTHRLHGSSASDNQIHCLAFAPDGSTVVLGTKEGALLWELESGMIRPIRLEPTEGSPHSLEIESAAFSRDGALLALAGSGGVRIWDVQQGRLASSIDISRSVVAFSPDGSLLATAEHHNRVHLWDPQTGRELAEAHAEMGPLYSVAWSPGGRTLLVGGEGGAKVYEVTGDVDGAQLRERGRLPGMLAGGVQSLAITPDGGLAASVGHDGAINLWAVEPQAAQHGSLAPPGLNASGGLVFLDNQRLAAGARSGVGHPERRPHFLLLADLTLALSPEAVEHAARAAAEQLVESLRAGDRRQVMVMVSSLGPQSAPAARILIKAMREARPEEAVVLGMALGRIGVASPEVVPALTQILLQHENVDVRGGALAGLQQISREGGEPVVRALAETIQRDESPDLRRAAERILSGIDPAAAMEAAERARQQPQPEGKVRQRDGEWFYEGRSLQSWITRLGAAFTPNEIYGRPSSREPLQAITAIGEPAVPALVEALGSNDWAIRRAGIAGLQELDSAARPAVPRLLILLEDETPGTAAAAADAIAAICREGEKPLPELRERLNDATAPVTRIAAARALAQLDPDDARPVQVLRDLLRDAPAAPDAPTRPEEQVQAAVAALQHLGPAAAPATPELGAIVADPEALWSLRGLAAEALGAIGPEAAPAMPALIEALGDDDPNVRGYVSRGIAGLGAAAIPALIEALGSDDVNRRQAAGWALQSIGPEAVPALQQAAEDADPVRAEAARQALGQMP